MKPLTIIKYISPLLFGGLILSFYYTLNNKTRPGCYPKPIQQQMEIGKIANKVKPAGFCFFKDIVSELFPVLKSLN